MYGMQQLHHQVQSKLFTHKISQALYKARARDFYFIFCIKDQAWGWGRPQYTRNVMVVGKKKTWPKQKLNLYIHSIN